MAEESEINRQIRNHVIFTYAKEALILFSTNQHR